MTKLRQVIMDLEKVAGSVSPSDLAKTTRIVFQALGDEGIPAVYCGGYAMSLYGLRRYTEDVDLLVPGEYKGKLEDLLWKTLKPKFPGATIKFTCKQTGVDVDIIYTGSKMGPKMLTMPPQPSTVSTQPIAVTLEELITMKLDSWKANGVKRSKDLGDVTELIQINKLPRDFGVDPAIRSAYTELWDALTETEDTD